MKLFKDAIPSYLFDLYYKPNVAIAFQNVEIAVSMIGLWDGVTPDLIKLVQNLSLDFFGMEQILSENKKYQLREPKWLYKIDDLCAPHTNENIQSTQVSH